MFVALAVLLMAWFVGMPLWLSVFTTVMAGLTVAVKFFHAFMDIVKAYIRDDGEEEK